MKILIIDVFANTKCRGIIMECRRREIDIEIIRSSSVALRRIFQGEEKIDGIVLDMELPIYEGEFILRRNEGERILINLKRRNSKIPVLVFSEKRCNTNYLYLFDQITNWEKEGKKFLKFLKILEKKQKE